MEPPPNIDGRARSDEEIEIDGGSFVGATLIRCTLVYRGGPFPNLERVRIIDSRWAFKGAAKRTLVMFAGIGLHWPDHADQLLAAAQRQITSRARN